MNIVIGCIIGILIAELALIFAVGYFCEKCVKTDDTHWHHGV